MTKKRKTRGYVLHAKRQGWPIEPIAVACDYCGKPAQALTGQQLYPHLPRLASKGFYVCRPCDARVGCHPGTWQPLGRLADAALRFAKQAAHAAFDPIWEAEVAKGVSRRDARCAAYEWLAGQLGIAPDACHIGMFDVAQCRAVVRTCASLNERAAA